MLGDDPAWAERAAAFSARVRDLGEFLAGVEPRAPRHPLNLSVAMQDSCHLRHAQRLPLSSAVSLRRIPGLTVVEPAEQDICCGSAGIYNITQPEAARELGDRKAAHVLATGAQVYASANPGCLVQVATALRRAEAARCRRCTRSSSSTPRSGTSARRACCAGPPLRRRASEDRVGDVDHEVAERGRAPRSRSRHWTSAARSASRPAQPSSAPPPARIGGRPDQNAATVRSPRTESVSAVAPAASRCSPRGTTTPKTIAAATAMIAQTIRNSRVPCSSPPAQVPTAARTVASAIEPIATGATACCEIRVCSCRHSFVVDSASVYRTAPAVVAAGRDSASPSEAICTWLLRAMPPAPTGVRFGACARSVSSATTPTWRSRSSAPSRSRSRCGSRAMRPPAGALAARPARDAPARVPVHAIRSRRSSSA